MSFDTGKPVVVSTLQLMRSMVQEGLAQARKADHRVKHAGNGALTRRLKAADERARVLEEENDRLLAENSTLREELGKLRLLHTIIATGVGLDDAARVSDAVEEATRPEQLAELIEEPAEEEGEAEVVEVEEAGSGTDKLNEADEITAEEEEVSTEPEAEPEPEVKPAEPFPASLGPFGLEKARVMRHGCVFNPGSPSKPWHPPSIVEQLLS